MVVELGLRRSLWVVIPAALLLMGIRLRQIKGWAGLKMAFIPTLIKTVSLPIVIGCTISLLHLPDQPRLAMVLMAGMPTAFAGLILAEEYDLERELIASSIVVSTLMLLATLPLWLWLYSR
nr:MULTISPECIES: AEC family transporter [unclassified Leptolyngbya]